MRESKKYISVAVPTPLRKTFQYRLKPDQQATLGAPVIIPFGRRKLVGVVISLDSSSKISDQKIREVVKVMPPDLCITSSILKLCRWAATYYHHPIGEVVSNALPGLIRKGVNPRSTVESLCLTEKGRQINLTELKRAPAQQYLLELLQSKNLERKELQASNIKSATIRTLVRRAWATWQSSSFDKSSKFQLKAVNEKGILPNYEQQVALRNMQKTGNYLLQGVTGSGKTEVYFQLIEPLLNAGRQALVLVPEIGLTPQTIARFAARFDVEITVLHSSISERERAKGWLRAKEGSVGIVLGTRSAVFAPLANPGIIIVDEEHDTSYKQQDGFRYSARDLAVKRGQFESCSVVLGSATPSLESLHNVEAKKYQHLFLSQRPQGSTQEHSQLVDTRHIQKREGLTQVLIDRINQELQSGNQVLVFLNRRGFAPVMMCSSCGWISQCPSCDARLTYHLQQNTLVCHHCGTIRPHKNLCQACGDNRVAAIGQGTQRIEQTLKALFQGFPILRIDRDSTRRKDSMTTLINRINQGGPAILVGTQLVAKGHHFPDVTLVAILDIDTAFYSTDYRALERLGQLILQVGGRAGRAEKPGRVIIQTEFASQSLLKKLIDEGYSAFAKEILKERHVQQLPPYQFHALIRAEANTAELAQNFLESILNEETYTATIDLLGPIPALMEKKAGKFRYLIIFAAKDRNSLHKELSKRIALAEQSKLTKKVRWSVDVDPVDLF